MSKVKGSAEVAKKANALKTLDIQYVDPSSIQPNEYNPNRQSEHEFELLCRSMKEDGFTQPIIVHEESKRIVDGEHRWRASQALGYKQIPVVFVKMNDEQMRIATLRHNRARGSEDIELSAQVLRDLRELGALEWAQDSLMLDDVEMSKLLDDVPAPDVLAGEQFKEAWEPDQGSATSAEETQQTQTVDLGGQIVSTAMTAQAIETQRQREKMLAAAKDEKEREMAREMTKMFRLSLIFSGDDAELVKYALGSQAAEKLIQVLRDWVAAHPEDAPPAKAE